MSRSTMWVRRSQSEIAANAKQRKKSPWFAISLALLFSAIVTIAWALGIPRKYRSQPNDPPAAETIILAGPVYFGISALILFAVFYEIQRLTGRPVDDSPEVQICPVCKTTQHAQARRCSCDTSLEPFSHWRWKK